jgi:hypothetical protein
MENTKTKIEFETLKARIESSSIRDLKIKESMMHSVRIFYDRLNSGNITKYFDNLILLVIGGLADQAKGPKDKNLIKDVEGTIHQLYQGQV